MKRLSAEWWQSLPPEKVGKETEKLVESLFADWNKQQGFAWHRLPDAKAARGALKAQPADYLVSRSAKGAAFIEVKGLKHEYRLPSERVSQLPTLHKFALAGTPSWILVHHYMHARWRIVSAVDLPFGVPSWNLRELPARSSPAEALLSTGYFS